MKLNFRILPLEIKLIIYDYFDPKDKIFFIRKYKIHGLIHIFIESIEEITYSNNRYVINFHTDTYYNTLKNIFYTYLIEFNSDSYYNYTISMYLRKSQVDHFRNKLT